MIKILLPLFAATISAEASFAAQGQMVLDHRTALLWQDTASPSPMAWESAVTYCAALSLGDMNDWRLPNKKELESIIDYGREAPSIDTTFQNTSSEEYWTSTTRTGYDGQAWTVNFYSGYVQYADKTQNRSVRCVRGGVE